MRWIYLLLISALFSAGCMGQPQTALVTDTPVPRSPTIIASTTPSSSEAHLVDMALIPAGAFTMGSSQATALAECDKYFSGCNPDEWYLNESPVHDVTLDAFHIDINEVTNGQYQTCVAAGDCAPPSRISSLTRPSYHGQPEFAHYPVIWVSWTQAQAYCTWRGARLPTEAEWEKAARGTDARLYPWGDSFEAGAGNFCDVNCPLQWANQSFDDGFADTAPVGSFPTGVSPYKLHDMGGNVNEWVADWYAADYYDSSPTANPTGPESGTRHSMRGGAFHTPAQGLRTTARPLSDPAGDYIGFRCAVSAQ